MAIANGRMPVSSNFSSIKRTDAIKKRLLGPFLTAREVRAKFLPCLEVFSS